MAPKKKYGKGMAATLPDGVDPGSGASLSSRAQRLKARAERLRQEASAPGSHSSVSPLASSSLSVKPSSSGDEEPKMKAMEE